MSIRARLTIAIAAILLVTVAVLGTVAVRSTRDTLTDQIDESVHTYAERRAKDPPKDDKPSDPSMSGYDYQVEAGDSGGSNWERNDFAWVLYAADGTVLDMDPYGYKDQSASPPDCPDIPSPELDAALGQIVTLPSIDGSISYRTLMTQLDNGNIQAVGAPLTDVTNAVNDVVRMVMVIGGVALAAAIALCWWVIRQGLRPVDHMVETAAAIAGGEMSARIENPDPNTELGRLGTALNDMLGNIEVANNARAAGEQRLRRFVADAAHELRTPLTSLRGYAELYRQGALADDRSITMAMGRIESEGARMARLVDDLLLLARLDQARTLESAPVDLGALVNDAVTDFKVVAPDRPITIDLGTDVVVAGDRLRLKQIVDNLLSNVRTHTPAGTGVDLTLAKTGNDGILTVTDHGPGIAPEDHERIFERFWRADPARTRSRGGSGLGLAIVASLVHAHQGEITLDSEPGNGATFVIRLPLASAS
ncbi:MAG TPA: HAMP domain-containing sensor histidine kinase [Thermomicrobiales bacterium]|nr:HAMP domain-containing sensor histidine kinase [Thermomicrobiales bacterium]